MKANSDVVVHETNIAVFLDNLAGTFSNWLGTAFCFDRRRWGDLASPSTAVTGSSNSWNGDTHGTSGTSGRLPSSWDIAVGVLFEKLLTSC